MPRRCSNCLTWHLDFSENKSSSSPAGQRPSQKDAGILCTGSLLKRSPLPFHDFRSFKWTCWTCFLGRGKCFTHFSVKVTVAKPNVWLVSCGQSNPVCGEQWLQVPSVCFRATKDFVGRCFLLPTSLLWKGSKHYILKHLQLGESCWQSPREISQSDLWLQTSWGQAPSTGKEKWHGFLLTCLMQP